MADIGITNRSFFGRAPEMFTYDEPVAELCPKRNPAGNKGTFGKVLLIAGSMNMAVSRDMFLYSKTIRTEKAKSNSGTHTSSSGRTHGGSGGSF